MEAVEAAGAIAWAWGNIAEIAGSNQSTALIATKTKVLPPVLLVMKHLFVNFHFLPLGTDDYSRFATVPICRALLDTFEITLNASIAHLSLSDAKSRELMKNPNPIDSPNGHLRPAPYSHRLCAMKYPITIWSGAGTILNFAFQTIAI